MEHNINVLILNTLTNLLPSAAATDQMKCLKK